MRQLLALAALVFVSSCAPPAAKKPANATKPEAGKKEETTTIATGKVEAVAKDEKGRTVLSVRADTSEIEVGDSVGVSNLKAVDGEIYEEGKLKSRFRADRGKLDQVKRLIHAEGNVVVKAPDGAIALRADAIDYRDGGNRIVAKGRVTVSSEAWKFGPFEDLYATPDLQRVGTPDRFP